MQETLSANTIFACLIPIGIFMFSLRWLGTPGLSLQTILDIIKGQSRLGTSTQPGYFSLERASSSYEQYRGLAFHELALMQNSYAKLGRAHKRLGYELGYPSKLTRLGELTDENAKLAKRIAALSREEFPPLRTADLPNSVDGDLARVRETLKHFVRDWSAEGAEERATIFGPILDALQQVVPDRRAEMKVILPGSGLGRLAWEISELGFHTTANELSYFMTLAHRFLLSPFCTTKINEHTVYPYIYWFSHQRTNDATFRVVTFPDVVPRLGKRMHLLEGDFLKHKPTSGPGYDYVVTLFFIDTSINILSTLEHIHAILRPGGQWINLGPLLWPGGAQARAELSLEEVLHLAKLVGFRIEGEDASEENVPEAWRRKTVSSEYTADKHAMMKWLYQAEFWVATKTTNAVDYP